jgi:hypothetical protein
MGYQSGAQPKTWRTRMSLFPGTSLSMCPALQTLPVATLSPAYLHVTGSTGILIFFIFFLSPTSCFVTFYDFPTGLGVTLILEVLRTCGNSSHHKQVNPREGGSRFLRFLPTKLQGVTCQKTVTLRVPAISRQQHCTMPTYRQITFLELRHSSSPYIPF